MIAALLLLAQLAEAKPIAIRSEVAKEPFTLGEEVQWTLEIEHDARDVYTLPPLEAGALSISGAPQTRRSSKDGHALTAFLVRFVDVSTLDPRLPDVVVKVDGPDGPRQLSVRGRPLKLRSLVKEEGEPNAEHAHHGPKPPVPVMIRSWLWLGILSAVAAVAAAIFGWRFWQKKRLQVEALPAAAPFSPEEEAMKRLVALRENGRYSRQTIFAVSEIVRMYLGRRYGFDAIDLTSEELLQELRKRQLARIDLGPFETELRWQDLVKFARVEPTIGECRKAIQDAVELVNRTRRPPEAREAA